MPVPGGIATRALWSHMLKRSEAEDRKIFESKIKEENNVTWELAAEKKTANST